MAELKELVREWVTTIVPDFDGADVERQSLHQEWMTELRGHRIYTLDSLREMANSHHWNGFVNKFDGQMLGVRLEKWYKSEGFGMAEEKELKFGWREGEALCNTAGKDWEYQFNDGSTRNLVNNEISRHYESWAAGKRDKTLHPLFLCLSGPGTGKSRMLDEFQSILCAFAQNEIALEMIERAYVFKVTFENGTAYNPTRNASHAIGSRMMFQLCTSPVQWDQFVDTRYGQCSPSDAIDVLCSKTRHPVTQMCVIILVDGLQKLEHSDPTSKGTMLYQALTVLSSLINSSRSFVIAACAATVMTPFSKLLSDSPQNRVYIHPRLLDPAPIFGNLYERGPPRILIDDMGGHGRALEILAEELKNEDLDNCSLTTLSNRVIDSICRMYPRLLDDLKQLKFALSLVLSRTPIVDAKVYNNYGVDDLIATGLFTYNGQILECAYVVIAILERVDSLNLPHTSYSELDHTRNPDDYSLELQCWQHWEDFNCRFRCLKSQTIKGNYRFRDLHRGAMLSADCEVMIESKGLRFEKLSKRLSTKSPRTSGEVCECKVGDYNAATMFQSAEGNPSGDAFCCIKLVDNGFVHEVHQYKHMEAITTDECFQREYEKAVNDHDYFVFITTGESKLEVDNLPDRCVFVDKSNWKAYYGPYWARAFFLKEESPPNINTDSRLCLEGVRGIGTKTAEAILRKRPFEGPEDAFRKLKKLKVSQRTLEIFRYN